MTKRVVVGELGEVTQEGKEFSLVKIGDKEVWVRNDKIIDCWDVHHYIQEMGLQDAGY
jgi:hypothetical protein